MLRPGNISRGLIATAMVAGILVGTPIVSGQVAAPPPGDQPAVDPAPPEPARALGMFNAVADWVKGWQTPMDPTGQPRVHAAAVTLRYEGSIVGRGVAISGDPAGSPGTLMMAASRAMNEAKTRLPVPHDALEQENLRAMAPMLAITVEIAGRPIPITPKEYADAINEVGPGLDGVAVRMGDRIEAMFPETMIVTGTDAAGALAALVSKVSGDPTMGLKKPGELSQKDGVAFYRLKVVQMSSPPLANPAHGSPTIRSRGGEHIPIDALDQRGLTSWAVGLYQHLEWQRSRDKGAYGIRGTYDPVRGTNEAACAGPIEQGLAALAMWRCLPLLRSNQFKVTFEDALGSTTDLAREAATVEASEVAPWSEPAAAAIWWRVLDEMCVEPVEHATSGASASIKDPTLVEMKRKCRDALVAALADQERATGEAGPLVAWAASGLRPADSREKELATAFLRTVLVNTPPTRLAGTMPWLGWSGISERAATGLREMRAELWQHQLRPEDLRPDTQDLAGGIVFSTSRQPLPTWQSARPLAVVASMLADPSLTESNEQSQELARLLTSLRFLRQLTAGDAECHMYKDRTRARGGVRNSLFDQRMPPEATAMTLLTVCETLKSLDAIKALQDAGKK